MTAVVPMTVRRRRCSERLSESTRLAPWQQTDSKRTLKGAIDTSITLSHGLELEETKSAKYPDVSAQQY